jgi:4-hydroxybenzoate polyprenyltransferase
MNRKLINWLGLLGPLSFMSYLAAYIGIPERFSILAVTFFNAILGIYLFNDFQTI